jgi:hypothetical protein
MISAALGWGATGPQPPEAIWASGRSAHQVAQLPNRYALRTGQAWKLRSGLRHLASSRLREQSGGLPSQGQAPDVARRAPCRTRDATFGEEGRFGIRLRLTDPWRRPISTRDRASAQGRTVRLGAGPAELMPPGVSNRDDRPGSSAQKSPQGEGKADLPWDTMSSRPETNRVTAMGSDPLKSSAHFAHPSLPILHVERQTDSSTDPEPRPP